MSIKQLSSDKPPCECSQVRKAAMEFLAHLQTVISDPSQVTKSEGQPTGMSASVAPLSPLVTVKEGAPILNRTESATRHMIFQSEAYAQLDDKAQTSGFFQCIVRPPGTRRVFLHRERLVALVESWAPTQQTNTEKE